MTERAVGLSRHLFTCVCLITLAFGQIACKDGDKAASIDGNPRISTELFLQQGKHSADFDHPSCGAFGYSGLLAVCEGAERKVLVFDSLGRHLFTFGRRGAGPGEFHTIAGVHFDSQGNLLIWDGGARKMAIVGMDGRLVRDIRLPKLTGWIPKYLGQVHGSLWAFVERTSFVPRAGDAEGLVRQWTRLLAYDTLTRQVQLIDSMVQSEAFARGVGFARVTFGLPFAASGHSVVAGSRLVVGFSRDSIVLAHDVQRGATDTLVLSVPLRPASKQDWEARWDTLVANAAEFRERIIAAKGDVPVFDTHPRYHRLFSTPRGSIAAYLPRDAEKGIYELRCLHVVDGDQCPSIATATGEVVLAITSGVAAVAIETPDGTWRAVRRTVSFQQ